MRSIPIDRHVSRPDTAISYSGVHAGNNSYHIDGEHHDPHKQQLGSYPLRVANAVGHGNATESDYGIKAKWHIQIIDLLIWMKDTLVIDIFGVIFRSFRRIETNT